MSKAAEIAAARMRAAQNAPGLGVPSSVPTDEEAELERQALEQLDTEQDPAVVSRPVAAQSVKQEDQQPPVDLLDAVSKMPGAPSKAELIAMKQQWPEVLFLPLRDNEFYIYRYLNHFEWRKQLLTQEKLVQDAEALKDAVLQRCVLWPKFGPAEMNTKQAGLRDLLYDVILKSSYFIEPEQALNLVMRL